MATKHTYAKLGLGLLRCGAPPRTTQQLSLTHVANTPFLFRLPPRLLSPSSSSLRLLSPPLHSKSPWRSCFAAFATTPRSSSSPPSDTPASVRSSPFPSLATGAAPKGSGGKQRKPIIYEHDWQPAVPTDPEELGYFRFRERSAAAFFNTEREFVTSALAPHTLPPEKYPEVAFIGVSNVGKSSLLNAVVGLKGLAQVSKTPGRTRTINFFRVGRHDHPDQNMYCVDLPGYGHAAVPLEALKLWTKSASYYIFNRGSQLRRVCLLIDPFVGFRGTDLQAMGLMDHYGVSFQVVLTKVDKLTKEAREKAVQQAKEVLSRYFVVFPTLFETSSYTGEGIGALRVSLMEACEIPFGDERHVQKRLDKAAHQYQQKAGAQDHRNNNGEDQP